MGETNTCSTARRKHVELVHLTAQLSGPLRIDGYALLAQHVQIGNACRSCREVWPCYGRRFAEQVVAAQGG